LGQYTRRELCLLASRAVAGAALTGLAGCKPADIPRSKQKSGAVSGELLLKYFPGVAQGMGPKPSHVVIIGAGAAGLAAGRILHDAGVKTTVLEARDRIGGRIWTVHAHGAPVDMNGGYLHDSEVNPLFKLYEELGWQTDPVNTADVRDNGFDAGTGESLSLYGKVKLLGQMNAFEEARPPRPASAADDYPVERYVREYFAGARLSGSEGRIIESIIRTQYSSDLSLASMRWSTELPVHGGDWVSPSAGFGQLVDALAKGLDIRLNEPVSRIELTSGGVSVTAKTLNLAASHILVTVPVGVLQAGGITFTPELPEKVQAVSSIAVSQMEKFVLALTEPLPWSFTTRIYYDHRDGCRLTFQNLAHRLKKPVAIAYAHTDYAKVFLTHRRSEREAIVVNALRRLVGDPKLQPISVIQSDWADSPYSRGAYSMIPAHGGPEHIVQLGQPAFDGRLLFAGEGTSPHRFTYVDGAVGSGVREARRLLSTKEHL